MVRLVSLAIEPRSGGLRLPMISFGDFLTHVSGENGSGKTAVMCSLYWALGGARQVEEPIWTECAGVRLTMTSTAGEPVTLYRAFSTSFEGTIETRGEQVHIQDEAAWSAALLPVLGVKPRQWSTKGGGTVSVYLSVLLPAFAIDQDKGWILPYSPFSSKNFVDDQAQEVVRLLLGLPKRHDPKREALRKELSDELEMIEVSVSVRSQALESLARAMPEDLREIEAVRTRRDRLFEELRQYDSAVGAIAGVDASIQQRSTDALAARDAAVREVAAARQRRQVLSKLMEEGIADLDLVGTNEVAADAFRLFCGNPACQFFSGSAEPSSYGRRVLYLRDQLKDITTAMDGETGVLSLAQNRLQEAESNLERVRSEYEAAARVKASDRVLRAVDGLTREFAVVSRNLALMEQIINERAARDRLNEEASQVRVDLKNHDAAETGRRKDLGGAARELSEAINRWLEILGANEVGAVSVDDELRLLVDGKTLTDTRGPSGSSRARLILAYHAAMLEVSLARGGNHPPLLLFDAPKQHELDPNDFAAYIRKLRDFFRERVQVVVSSRTEIPTESGDAIWKPLFPGEKHPWYLGPQAEPAVAPIA